MIPAKVQAKADVMLDNVLNGVIRPRVMVHITARVVNVGRDWRLVCADPAKQKIREGWRLVSHSEYNQIVSERGRARHK